MVEHLSYSSVNTYHLCPRSWKLRYVDKVKAPTSSAQVFGGAFHNTVEARIRALATDPARAVLMAEIWPVKWQAKLKHERAVDWGDDTPDSLAELGAKMTSDKDIAAVVDSIKPLNLEAIERKVTLAVPGIPVPVIGYIDIITADGVPSDFKTSSRSWNKDKAPNELQPLFYLAALNQSGFALNPGLKFRHYVFVKTKNPKAQVIETQRMPGELFWLFDTIRETWRAICAGAFPPNPSGWKCSPRYCEYWSRCRGAF